MKIMFKLILILSFFTLTNSCKEDENDTDNNPNNNQFKGYIYYNNGDELFRFNMMTQSPEKLFKFATYPDITDKGEILVNDGSNSLSRLIFTDLTGANRRTIIESDEFNREIHRRYFENPRISYDQKYIAYDGGASHNSIIYIIEANSGELLASFGDASVLQYFQRPSWAPDGSLFVSGWPGNNGIYKISSDFTSISKVELDIPNIKVPSVSPDGKFVAFTSNDQVWIMGIDGTNPRQLYINSEKFDVPTWSPDSKYIVAVTSSKLVVLDITNNVYTVLTQSEKVSNHYQLCWVY
jgi:Tol biopolymer transport system component